MKEKINLFLSLSKLVLAVGGGFEPPTMQLALKQNLVVNPSLHWKKPVRLYFTFILNPSPPRQEGTAASFVILQYVNRSKPKYETCFCFSYFDATKLGNELALMQIIYKKYFISIDCLVLIDIFEYYLEICFFETLY